MAGLVAPFTITANGNYPAGGVLRGTQVTAAAITAAIAAGDSSGIANAILGTGLEPAGSEWPQRTIHLTGGFGGGNITLQASEDGGVTWFAVQGYAALNAPGKWNVIERFALLRLVGAGIAGATIYTVIV